MVPIRDGNAMYPKVHNLRVITKGILMGKQRIHLQQM